MISKMGETTMNPGTYLRHARARKRNRLGFGVVALTASLVLATSASASTSSNSSNGGNTRTSSSSKGSYVIGAIADLSAGFTGDDVPWNDGIEAGIKQINTEGGVNGHKIRLVSLDAAGLTTTGLNDFRQLESDGASAILNVGDTTVAEAIDPLANAAHINLIAVAPAPSELTSNSYMFEFDPTSTQVAYAQMAYIKSLHVPSPRIAVVAYPDPIGQAYASNIGDLATKAGMKYVGAVYPASTSDDSADATKIASMKANIIVSELVESGNTAFMQSLSAVGVSKNTLYVGYTWSVQPKVPWANFAVAEAYRGSGRSAATQKYAAAAKAAGYSPSTPLVVEGYAATLLLADALRSCGYPCGGQKLHSALQHVNTNVGGLAFGNVKWTSSYHFGPTSIAMLKFTRAGTPGKYGSPVNVSVPAALK